MNIALDSADLHTDYMKLIEKQEKKSVVPLLVSTVLVACGLLTGLKAAEMRQFTAGTMTMCAIVAIMVTVTSLFGIEMTQGWLMVALLSAFTISLILTDKVASKHLQKVAGVAAGS